MLKQKGAFDSPKKTICFHKGYLLLFALSFLINRGQNTEFILEIFAEILGVVKAQLIRYLRYILLTLAQHLRRSFQTDDTDKFNGCLTGYLQEFLVKMYPAHTQSPAQLFYGQVTPTDVRLHIFDGIFHQLSSSEVMAISLGSGSMSDFALRFLLRSISLRIRRIRISTLKGFVT